MINSHLLPQLLLQGGQALALRGLVSQLLLRICERRLQLLKVLRRFRRLVRLRKGFWV